MGCIDLILLQQHPWTGKQVDFVMELSLDTYGLGWLMAKLYDPY